KYHSQIVRHSSHTFHVPLIMLCLRIILSLPEIFGLHAHYLIERIALRICVSVFRDDASNVCLRWATVAKNFAWRFMLDLCNELNDSAALSAAETIETVFRDADCETGLCIFMEWA